MSIIYKALMERKMCIHGLKRKYPGLPEYVMDNMTVMKIILCESAEEYIMGLSSYQEAPSQENILLAARLRSEYTANSRLAAVMGKPLDWMYGKDEYSHVKAPAISARAPVPVTTSAPLKF